MVRVPNVPLSMTASAEMMSGPSTGHPPMWFGRTDPPDHGQERWSSRSSIEAHGMSSGSTAVFRKPLPRTGVCHRGMIVWIAPVRWFRFTCCVPLSCSARPNCLVRPSLARPAHPCMSNTPGVASSAAVAVRHLGWTGSERPAHPLTDPPDEFRSRDPPGRGSSRHRRRPSRSIKERYRVMSFFCT